MIKSKTKKFNILNKILIFTLLFIISLLAIMPSVAIQTFLEGINIWATKILPALLPFFILTKLLSYTSFTQSTGNFLSPVTQKLYGVGGVAGYVYIMSILSGYPVGAKLTSDLYKNGTITKGQAFTISSFTSTSGPLFILGTVGIGFFKSQKIGIIVLISHFLSAIINGFFYRNKNKDTSKNLYIQNSTNILNDSMYNSIISIMIVGGFIALFYMILQLLLYINAFNIPIFLLSKIGVNTNLSTAIISGIVEVTTGANLLSQCLNLSTDIITIILSFLVSFGGLSIHAQAYCFLKNFNMSYPYFLLQKITHAILSASVTFIVLIIF